jgi:hypothetical protein
MMPIIDRLAAGLEQMTRESIACLSRPTFASPGSESSRSNRRGAKQGVILNFRRENPGSEARRHEQREASP